MIIIVIIVALTYAVLILSFLDNITFDEEPSSKIIIIGPNNIQTSINITCTVIINSILLEWTWFYGNDQLSIGDRYNIITDSTTTITTLTINNITYADSGDYYCRANYINIPASTISQTQQKHLNLIGKEKLFQFIIIMASCT